MRWTSAFDKWWWGKMEWHKWFAWRPVRLNRREPIGQMVWLETVDRKKVPAARQGWTYIYREVGDHTNA